MPCTIRVPPLPELARRWGEIEPILKRATDRTHGRYEPIHLLQQAMSTPPVSGFWLVEDGDELIGVAVGFLQVWPSGVRDLDVSFLAGKRFRDWWDLFVADAERVARAAGCAAITAMQARPGWARFWGAHGVKVRVGGEAVIRDLI